MRNSTNHSLRLEASVDFPSLIKYLGRHRSTLPKQLYINQPRFIDNSIKSWLTTTYFNCFYYKQDFIAIIFYACGNIPQNSSQWTAREQCRTFKKDLFKREAGELTRLWIIHCHRGQIRVVDCTFNVHTLSRDINRAWNDDKCPF